MAVWDNLCSHREAYHAITSVIQVNLPMANVDSSSKPAIILSSSVLSVFCFYYYYYCLSCQGIEITGGDMCPTFELMPSFINFE